MPTIPTGRTPFEVVGWPERFVPDERFKVAEPFDENTARWWVERFTVGETTLYPGDVAERLTEGLPGEIDCTFTVLDPTKDRVSIEIFGTDVGGNKIWFVGKSIWLDAKSHMFTDLAEVAVDRQGEGIGRRIMSNCYELAQTLDLDEMRLRASWVGTYAWLRLGFLPDDATWNTVLKSRVVEGLYDLEEGLPRSKFLEVMRMLDSSSARTAWSLADDRTPIRGGERDGIALGQALFANSGVSWDGVLNLTDNVATARLETYVGLR